MNAPVAPLSLRARAYENFRQQILRANVRPGQFVSQRELMQLLDMPLGAVRELIPRLEAEGLLRTVPQRGLQIAHVDLKLIHNAFALRSLLEREAALRFVQVVSHSELEAIERSHLDIVARARSGPIDDELLTDATSVDWGLHDLMIDTLGNELISQTYRINSLRVRLINLERSTLSAEVLLPAMQEHLNLIDAFKQRDPQQVAQKLAHHIHSAHQRVLGQDRRVPGAAPPAQALTSIFSS
ncbi:MAG: GntR family transcriptional regulator [Comamonadaceae bacterium]|jgi:DNA-binding GntR family transcriptional regulator|nr:GntR family transcriptional regulator [Comamonadaceae bacterium]